MEQIVARIRLLLVYIALLLPVIAYGAVHALKSSNNSPIDWVDSSFAERKHYDEFVELFGPGDAVIASWPECYWTDDRLDHLVRILRESKVFRTADGGPLFHQVVCGREVLLQMSRSPNPAQDGLESNAAPEQTPEQALNDAVDTASPATTRSRVPLTEAIQRLQGTVVGKDGRLTSLVVTLNSAGLADRAAVVKNLRRAIRETCQVADDDIHLAGPVIDGLTVDEASHASLTRFAAPSAIVIFAICWWSLRSLLAALVVFLTASFCQAALLAVIFYSGERLSALLIILPPLVQVLTVSGGIHLMNYYQNALETLSPREAAIEAFHKGWLPSILSLGTTAMGTASLMVSGLEPIRLFGIYGTVGVLLASAAVLTVIPCSMILLGRKDNRGKLAPPHDPAEPPRSGQYAWYRLASLLNRRNSLCLMFLFGVMIVCALGLPALQTSIRIETLFPKDSRIMQDYRWLEDNLGPLVPIEVLVSIDDASPLNNRRRMDLLWRVNRVLLKHPHVRSATSALTFFPDMPSMQKLPSAMRSGVLNKAISMAKPAFEQMGMLRRSSEGEVWRITAHVSALEPLDYGDILQDLRAAIAGEADTEANTQTEAGRSSSVDYSEVEITTSGIMPLVHKIQGQLLTDLFSSLMSALLVITLTMTIVEAGFLSGLTAMTSNVFPIVIAFGLMGLLNHPMDIGSVMTASIALGIAVDDTLHFLTFFRRMIRQPGATRFSAVLNAYEHCGAAMIQTSVSCGIGLLVFAFSDFVPTSRFAVLMAFLLLLALLGDLLLLPALLLSPAGRFFAPSATDEASHPPNSVHNSNDTKTSHPGPREEHTAQS